MTEGVNSPLRKDVPMKKLVSLCLSVLLAVTLLASAALADGAAIRVSAEEAEAGDTVTVTVALENNPGIMAFDLAVDYDTSRLEKVDYGHSGLGGFWSVGESIVWVAMSEKDYTGEFLQLKFRVLEDAPNGEAYVTIVYDEGDICNYNEEPVSFAVIPGGVTVSGGTEAPAETEAPSATDAPQGAVPSDPAGDTGDAAATPRMVMAETPRTVESETETALSAGEEPVPAGTADGGEAPAAAGEASVVLSEETPAPDSGGGFNIVPLLLALGALAVVLVILLICMLRKSHRYKGKH